MKEMSEADIFKRTYGAFDYNSLFFGGGGQRQAKKKATFLPPNDLFFLAPIFLLLPINTLPLK